MITGSVSGLDDTLACLRGYVEENNEEGMSGNDSITSTIVSEKVG